jgi:hypothetical protein
MTRLHRFFATLAALLAATGLLTTGLLFAGASSASAVTATGHGVGYLSSDGFSWIGSYRLADGALAFCLESGKQAPTGHEYRYVEQSSLGWYSADDAARLAFISRTWATSDDPDLAAAGQLATWTIAGLDSHTQEQFAARAGAHAYQVLHGANDLIAIADAAGGASRGVSAAVSLSPIDASGHLSVSSNLTADFLSGGQTVIEKGKHEGTLSLTGAVFADGSNSKTITNGTSYDIAAAGPDGLAHVTAAVSFGSLPYGSAFRVGLVDESVQTVMIAGPGSAEGRASRSVTVPSSLPFQPRVVTQTSSTQAEPGAAISDALELSALPGDGTIDDWGVYEYTGQDLGDDEQAPKKGTMLPIPVVVESSLLGPFSEPIAPAHAVPENAPVVCTVEVAANDGPGSYRTEECTLPAAGNYVWVEKINPERTPADRGGDRVRAWQSDFGTATEVTTVTTPPVETPPATAPPVAAPPAPPAPPAPVLAETGLSAPPLGLAGGLGAGIAACGVLFLRRGLRLGGIRKGDRPSASSTTSAVQPTSPSSVISEPRAS